jgi:hypothetical protein
MAIYTKFAAWGLPCPITGHPNSGKFGGEQQQQAGGGGGGASGGAPATV